jgi:hypothetical protein
LGLLSKQPYRRGQGRRRRRCSNGNTDLTFTIRDLLANDPGGAAKLGISQFFFGDNASFLAQKAYLDLHHIGYDPTQTTGFTLDSVFTLNIDSIDFQYMVQIGNKGTWSQGDVDVSLNTASLHQTWDFESPLNSASGVVSYSAAGSDTYTFDGSAHVLTAHDDSATTVGGWTINSGSVEVVTDPYIGLTQGNAGANETQWIDTQGRANGVDAGIDISKQVDLGTGVHAEVSISGG